MKFPDILERFLSYVKIDTQSKEESDSFPSTKKQFNLAKKLKSELEEFGLENVIVNKWGYVLGTLKTNQNKKVPTIALISHLDTSPDVSGENVNPQIHKNYNGKDLTLSKKNGIVLKVEDNPIKYLIKNPMFPRPNIRIVFTPDEEIGRGTEHITKEEIKADYAYTVDGEKLGEIEDETFCADSVEIKIYGVNVHPGYAKGKLVNAIKIAGEIIEQFTKDKMSPETTEKREGYIHPYIISGNTEESTIKILIRDFEEKGLIDKENFIKKIVDQIYIKYPKAKIDFKVTESYRNMKIILNKYPEILSKAVKAIEMSNTKPIKNIIRGGTDGAKLSFMGLPTPNLFTGGSNFHSKYEWVTLEDMQKAAEVIVNLMKVWTE